MRKLILPILIILLLNTFTFANELPYLNYERIITDKDFIKKIVPNAPNILVDPRTFEEGFIGTKRNLGKNINEILPEYEYKNKNNGQSKYEFERININNYEIQIIKKGFGKIIYILNNENLVIGYCLLSGFPLLPNIKSQIIQFDKNINYLDTLTLSEEFDFQVYEKLNNNFIERYILCFDYYTKLEHKELIAMESFFPIELQSYFKEETLKYIDFVHKYNLKYPLY